MENNWGIIAAGGFADKVFASAIAQADQSRLVAVMARKREKAAAFAQNHGVSRYYDSVESLCQDDEVEMVYISSPTMLHCEHTLTAARYGKHVLCEKPMAPTLEECDTMIRVCADAGVTLAVAHNMRFHRVHQEVRRLVTEQRVGTLGMVRAEMMTSFKKNQGERFRIDQFRLNRAIAGGGVMFDMGIHTLDVLRYIVGDEIEEITAFSQKLFLECNGEDTVSVILRFKNGVYGSVSVSGAIPYARNGVDVYGDRGALFTDGSVWIKARSGEISLVVDDESETIAVPVNNCYIAEVEHFIDCVRNNKTPWVDGFEGKRNVQAILATYKSIDEGRPVRIE